MAEPLLRWIVLAPLVPAAIHALMIGLLRRSMPRRWIATLSCGAVLLSFAASVWAFADLIRLEGPGGLLLDTLYTWVGVGIAEGAFAADLAFQMDALSGVMCLVVTGIGFLIHVYSSSYMEQDDRDDRGYQRFFCYLNLFIAAMLVLVLADNLLLMFVGWEGVGLCSYLLIGFWYSDEANAYAGSKAFVVNRIGDFGFLIGILLLFWSLAEAGAPTISFRGMEDAFSSIAEASVALPEWLGGGECRLATLIGLCLFLGAVGKSAQLPLYVWLPDAMAGPTPVSALIHAATMVTAGVYMVCRMSFLYSAAPGASAVMAWTGALTALFAALVAVAQTDIKKVLAYSTISQVGYMFLAAGCGAYTVAMFHVVTHAFFKALLFLGAGAVILAVHHQQDLRAMGGLRKRMRGTWLVMMIGGLAIAGCPPLSGFFSKDEILTSTYAAHALPGHQALYWMALLAAVLTAFYIGRMFLLAFHGKSRIPSEERRRIHDPDTRVMYPLYALAAMSVVGGFLGPAQFWGDVFGLPESDSLGNFLATAIAASPAHELETGTEWKLVGAAVAAFALGTGAAAFAYLQMPGLPARIAERLPTFHRLLERRFYIEEIYDALLVRPLLLFSDRFLFRLVEVRAIDGLAVEGTARGVRAIAEHGLKYLHSGLTQSYLLVMVVAALAILWFLVR